LRVENKIEGVRFMKKNILLVVAFLSLVIWSQVSGIDKISVKDANQMVLEKKAIVVDVREQDETKDGFVKGAILVPISVMKNNKDEWKKIENSLPKDKTIVLYCKGGVRAGMVGEELSKKGFKVLNMGGFSSWQEAGLPVEKK
jgi:rhodanese-related sulfurtransferase